MQHLLARLQRYTPRELVRKVPRYARGRARTSWARLRDNRRSTYGGGVPEGRLHLFFTPEVAAALADTLSPARRAALAGTAAHYAAGSFDLLGSGWQPVHHGLSCLGLEGYRYPPAAPVTPDPEGRWLEGRVNDTNLAEAQALWQCVDPGYTPIDWHLDFRTGYRWPANRLSQDLTFGDRPGVDVKVPWELSRMHHLPQLALAYAVAQAGPDGFDDAEVYARAFRNQVLDFLATNPPRFGINWYTAMLTGIRGTNLALAFDLFSAAGYVFDEAFTAALTRSLHAHARHTLAYLEWWDFDERNNHYLSNIVGLLIMAAYLPAAPETDAWLSFGYRELLREAAWQFSEDGSGFEASTCYHAFSAEMVAWGTAYAEAIPPARRHALATLDPAHLPRAAARRAADVACPDEGVWPEAHYLRLGRVQAFLRDTTHPDGQALQVGDNDSGRFLKLAPWYHRRSVAEVRARYTNLASYAPPEEADTLRMDLYWDEDLMNYTPTYETLAALTAPGRPPLGPEAALVRALAAGVAVPIPERPAPPADAAVLADWQARADALPAQQRHTLRFEAPQGGPFLHDLMLSTYPDFGLFVLRSPRLMLTLRCGPTQLRSAVGHPHDDQLSLTLWIDGQALLTDPGTYVYTALLDRRNQYRSAAAHFVPFTDSPAEAPSSAFEQPDWQPATCLYAGPDGFVGRLDTPAGPCYRLVSLSDQGVSVTDFTLTTTAGLPRDLDAAYAAHRAFPTTVGYGKRLRQPTI